MAFGVAPSISSRARAPSSLPKAASVLANVLYEKKNSVAYVTVNRPKVLNALNTSTWADLETALQDAKADVSVRDPYRCGRQGLHSRCGYL